MKFKPDQIKLIIGLGNPDKQYKNTYHNVGFLFIDYLKKHLPPTNYKLLKSNTYMNNSGKFVKKKIDQLNLNSEEILVVHDDSDITLGSYKLSFNRGSAGHKGVQSIISQLGGNKEFWRARIGVREEDNEKKAKKFILEKISKNHKDKLEEVFWEITTKLN